MPLRRELAADAIIYICDDCRQRASVGADWRPVGSQVPANEPMTNYAREALARLPAVLTGLKGGRITKTSVWKGLGVDRNTLDAWIGKGWMTWPPSD